MLVVVQFSVPVTGNSPVNGVKWSFTEKRNDADKYNRITVQCNHFIKEQYNNRYSIVKKLRCW